MLIIVTKNKSYNCYNYKQEKFCGFEVATREPRTSPLSKVSPLLRQYENFHPISIPICPKTFYNRSLLELTKICHLISLRTFAENREKVHKVPKGNPSCGYFHITFIFPSCGYFHIIKVGRPHLFDRLIQPPMV